ncbi:hypothetical protein EMIHUDRAFT_464924 [Emiliania huxleyi CCMP1516]|uniref:ShKT domain-containing protein n=2 Tax=Emiliania huxleyi TaxID=2903 RepID=A0A0D3ILR2_EMIH1|nr:hypothetical protein EMIHUDRAFT_464924 [Emiliania huxleyi CCMP1516]EOD12197.1 hypothetical protein EMIHUDRAFT_464924 [Emiliania huxleyi CCMP1516]|eukprot:XP_005764626.1 hypothetical protein EMIHUDRAFT_464924 [Emiliania huxleyi CCMP1516]
MMVDSPFCSTGTVGYSTRAENYGRVTAVCCHGACPRCADREESPECDASAIADGALCSTASATSCVLPASAGGLAANTCVDAWALAFPTEVHRWQGRSCHFKRKWRQCSEFWAGCRCSCGNCSASGGHQPQSCAPHAAITTAAAIATDGASNLKALAGPPPSSSSSSSPLSGAATALAIAAEAGGASPATVAVLLTGGGSVLLFAGVALCCFLSGGKGGGKGGGGASSRRQRRPRSGAASPLSDEDEFGSFHGPSSSCWLEDDDGSGERRAGTRGARGTTREALRRRALSRLTSGLQTRSRWSDRSQRRTGCTTSPSRRRLGGTALVIAPPRYPPRTSPSLALPRPRPARRRAAPARTSWGTCSRCTACLPGRRSMTAHTLAGAACRAACTAACTAAPRASPSRSTPTAAARALTRRKACACRSPPSRRVRSSRWSRRRSEPRAPTAPPCQPRPRAQPRRVVVRPLKSQARSTHERALSASLSRARSAVLRRGPTPLRPVSACCVRSHSVLAIYW